MAFGSGSCEATNSTSSLHGTKSLDGSSRTAALANDQVRLLPKWQIVGAGASGVKASTSKPLQRPVASLKPGSAPQKATLLTENGPQDVSEIREAFTSIQIRYLVDFCDKVQLRSGIMGAMKNVS